MRALVVSGVLVTVVIAGPVSAVAGEFDSAPSAADQNRQPEPSAATLPGNNAAFPDNICRAIAIAAAANNLSADFLTRVIRRESGFRPEAVNGARAEGLPQPPPGTATFDPFVAIAKSAQRLRDLYREFGNPGLATAAYNAGPDQVRDWLAGRRPLPDETQSYIRIVTGRPAEEWAAGQKDLPEMPNTADAPCSQTAMVPVQAPSHPIPWTPPIPMTPPVRVVPQIKPWGVELAGGPTRAKALAKYHELQLKYRVASILAGREPQLITRGKIGDMGAVRVRIGTETRAEGIKLCTSLSARGWFCDVLRN
jgi:hypothetical protein